MGRIALLLGQIAPPDTSVVGTTVEIVFISGRAAATIVTVVGKAAVGAAIKILAVGQSHVAQPLASVADATIEVAFGLLNSAFIVAIRSLIAITIFSLTFGHAHVTGRTARIILASIQIELLISGTLQIAGLGSVTVSTVKLIAFG